MIKKAIFICLFAVTASLSFGQTNDWKEYFSNGDVSVYYQYSECHYPSKGIHHENVLLRIVNHTSQPAEVSYHLKRVYNGKEVKADVSDFTFTVPSGQSIESKCEDLKEGLYVFSRILDVKANSVLNSFDLNNLTINGKTVSK